MKAPTKPQLAILQRVEGGRIAVCSHEELRFRRGNTTITRKVYISEVNAAEELVGERMNHQVVDLCEYRGWIEVDAEGWLKLTTAGRAVLDNMRQALLRGAE